MRKDVCIAVSLVAALAACGKSGDQGNGKQSATGSSAAATGSGPIQIQPGEWEMTYETVNVSGAGLPPGYLAAMKGHKVTRRDCITPEQAAQPMAKMMDAQQKGQCDYKGFSIANGHIQGTVSCGSGGKTPGKMTMTMNGQYDGQSYAYTSSMTNEGQGMNMTIESRSTAHRIGECTAGAKDDSK
jgi:hypothetical protein